MLSQNRHDFEATMAQFHVNINEVTGGNSYAEVAPVFVDMGKNEFPLVLHVIGRYALMDILVEFKKLPIPDEGSPTDFVNYLNGVNVGHENVGNVAHDTGRFLTYRLTDFKKDKINEWSVNIFARNRITSEDLKMRWNDTNKKWEYSYKVIEEIPAKGGKQQTYRVLTKTTPEWRTYGDPPKK